MLQAILFDLHTRFRKTIKNEIPSKNLFDYRQFSVFTKLGLFKQF